MQFRKIAAVAGSALMAGMTLAGAAMAATNVGNIASLAAPVNNVANFPIFVIGKTAQTSDVAGAIDIAVRMAAESKTTTTVTTTGTTSAITGVEKDGIAIGTSSGGTTLDTGISGGAAFPNLAVLRNAAFSNLKDSTYTWNGNSYTYREQVDLSSSNAGLGVKMRHDLGTDKINGTEKMVIADSSVVYEYVFTQTVNLSTATTAGTTGTISNPEYSKPIKLTMLGQNFQIVGVDGSNIKVLNGATGTVTHDTSTNTGLSSTDGKYKAYVTAGVDGQWATIKLLDATGNTVDTQTVYATGSTHGATTATFSAAGLDVQATAVRVTGTDPTTQHIEADLVMGATGTTTHTYTTSAPDVTTTGTSNAAFPGASRWGIQYNVLSATGTPGAGQIPAGAKIQVIYRPVSTEYYVAGQALSLPNNFASLGFEGWNTNNFATITIKPYGSTSGYFQNGTAIPGTLYGLQISSDKTGSIVSPASNLYSTAYLLFNATRGTLNPVLVGYPDITGKILTNDSWVTGAAGAVYNNPEYAYGLLSTADSNDQFNYTFKVNAGQTNFYINVRVGNTTTGGIPVIRNMTIGTSSAGTIQLSYTNHTVWDTAGANQLSTQFVHLGPTAATADATDINVSTEGAVYNAGTKSMEIVDDSGILVENPNSNGGSDTVVVKVPDKALAVKAYFGLTGAPATTGGTTTSSTVIPITTDVVKLDTEVTDPTTLNNNVVLVGGPCVNMLVASLATSGKFDYKCDATSAGTQPVWPASNFALVKVIQDAFQVGNVAVVVAGTRPQDTDLASQVVQSGKLSGNNATSVKVTGDNINNVMVA